MSDMIYIADMNLFVNMDQVISAEFEPEAYYDIEDVPDGEQPHQKLVPAKMTLVTAELEVHQVDGYDGAFLGAASKNVEIIVSGHSARALFGRLKDISDFI
jgi:hypothetical protein